MASDDALQARLLDLLARYLADARSLYPEAVALQRQGLALLSTTRGDEHPDTLAVMNNLAETLRAQGDLAGALEMHKSVLATRRRVLGEEHPDTLTSMNNLASTLYAQGDLAGALELQKSALAIRRRVLGEAHPNSLISAWNLFRTALHLEDAATAKEVFESFLLPLLQADPAGLPASSRTIRQHLLAIMQPPDSSPAPPSPETPHDAP
jgi:tetratricopeptide (TPR) repeat protein